MRSLVTILFSAACASTAFAQLDPYTVTATATSLLTSPPDQLGININVTLPAGVDVFPLIQSAGLTAANLNEAYAETISIPTGRSGSTSLAVMDWNFQIWAPLATISNTLNTLAALQAAISRQNAEYSFSFSPVGAQVSPQLQASLQCPLANLVAQARSQAQVLANATGFALGEVSAISSKAMPPPPAPDVGVAVLYTQITGALIDEIPSPEDTLIATSPSCVVEVEFKLTPSGVQ